MNIYEKLACITAELRTVAKNLTVETGRGKGYKAVSERDIIDAVKPLEEKYGVYSYPCDRIILESQMLDSVTEYKDRDGNVQTTHKTTFFSRIQTTYRFVNVEDPTEFVDTVTFAEGIDAQDKGSGKAMTYGDKYALMKAYKISTGDDPDQTASTEEDYRLAGNTQAPVGSGDFVPTCAKCGAQISVAEHDYSVKGWKRPLCRKCQKEEPRK